jgi:hypothetical protein
MRRALKTQPVPGAKGYAAGKELFTACRKKALAGQGKQRDKSIKPKVHWNKSGVRTVYQAT